jgi:hypothetical protein
MRPLANAAVFWDLIFRDQLIPPARDALPNEPDLHDSKRYSCVKIRFLRAVVQDYYNLISQCPPIYFIGK